jgi:uncharacterized membrane protein YphA (DoxX/SURF4 family)
MAGPAQPPLTASTINNEEGLKKIRLLVGSAMNEWEASGVWLGVAALVELSASYSILAGLVPRFSQFFHAVLDHY